MNEACSDTRKYTAFATSVALIMHNGSRLSGMRAVEMIGPGGEPAVQSTSLSLVTPENSREFHQSLAVFRLPRQYPVEQLLQAIGRLRRAGASLRQLAADFGGALQCTLEHQCAGGGETQTER